MKVISKYICQTVFSATIVVFFVFFGLRLFVGVFGELGALGTGHYNILQAMEYILLTMPLNIYQLYPNIALLGSLAGLGILAGNNELTVVRASGVSIAKITANVLFVALLLTGVMTVVGELVAPQLDAFAEQQKFIAEHGDVPGVNNTGLWVREGNAFIYIGKNLPNNTLQDITRFEFNDNYQLISSSYALSAKSINDQWQFFNVHTTTFYPDHVVSQVVPEVTWPLKFKAHLLAVLDPNQMTLVRLLKQAHYNLSNGLDAKNYQLSFWMRVLQPLATLVMVFLAIPFIFGPLRSSTMGLRILSGVMAGLAFYIINRFFAPFSIVYQIPPVIAAIIPITLFFLLAIFLVRRKG